MKNLLLSLLALALLCGAGMADGQTDPCSLNVWMVDWIETPGSRFHFGPNAEMGFFYTGTAFWDLAMGDSVLVWLPGATTTRIFIDPYQTGEIDTAIDPYFSDAVPYAVVIQDSLMFFAEGPFIRSTVYESDSTHRLSLIFGGAWDEFHYAVLEDTFLYTVDFENNEYTCVNVANPESIFVYRTFNSWHPIAGLEVIDGYLYGGCPVVTWIELDPDLGIGYYHPGWNLKKINMLGGDSATFDSSLLMENRYCGDLAANDSLVFYVNTELGNGPFEDDLIGFERGYS